MLPRHRQTAEPPVRVQGHRDLGIARDRRRCVEGLSTGSSHKPRRHRGIEAESPAQKASRLNQREKIELWANWKKA